MRSILTMAFVLSVSALCAAAAAFEWPEDYWAKIAAQEAKCVPAAEENEQPFSFADTLDFASATAASYGSGVFDPFIYGETLSNLLDGLDTSAPGVMLIVR